MSYINTQLELSNNKSQMVLKILPQLTKGQHANPLPDSSSQEELANKFADFFINKIKKIRSQFSTQICIDHPHETVQIYSV